MLHAEALWSESSKIIRILEAGLVLGTSWAWRKCRRFGKKPYEPDLVAGIVLGGVPFILRELRSVLNNKSVLITGASVYCHSSPLVSYDPKVKSCELGDILFVFRYTVPKGLSLQNALLCQVKLSDTPEYKVPKKERHQLKLYAEWPDFNYVSPRISGGKKISVNPKCLHPGAQYLLLDNSNPQTSNNIVFGVPGMTPGLFCMPDLILRGHSSFAFGIFNSFLFLGGRPFENRQDPLGKKDWSEMIWDLLEFGLKKAFSRKRSGIMAQPRFSGDPSVYDGVFSIYNKPGFAVSIIKELLGEDGIKTLLGKGEIPPGSISDFDDPDDYDSGVSIVIIEAVMLE